MDKQSSLVQGKTVKQVKKLNLSGRNLTEIPDYVFEYTNLTKLILSRNAITRIPKEIAKLKKLEVLDLTYNRLNTLPAPVFKLPKLRVLAVGHNALKKFPAQLNGSHIEELIADHNKIEKIDANSLDGLKKIIIGHNPILGQIITHTLPNLRLYDFRGTKLDTPSKEYLNEDCKGWQSGYVSLEAVQDSQKDSTKKSPVETARIFISHSSKDKEIVEKFSDEILQLGLGILRDKIKCTSIEGQGIPNGEKMREWIAEQIGTCSIAFLMISPAYQSSQICLNEMGAIWALNKKVKILLLPGAEYGTMGWLYEIKQAGYIGNASALNQLANELKDELKLNVNISSLSRKVQDFLDYYKDYTPNYSYNLSLSQNDSCINKIYLEYCDRIFDLLHYQKFSCWMETVVSARPRIPTQILDDFDSLRHYLDSRNSHEGYEIFDEIFGSLSLCVNDFMEVFNLYADAGTEVTRIRAFYKEEAINPNYDEDLKDYNAYVSFIHNLGFEIMRLCNKLLCEIRSIKVDYLSSFGIFSIDEVSDPQGRVARFIYRKDESYKGLKGFLDSSTHREFYRTFEKERVERILRGIIKSRCL